MFTHVVNELWPAASSQRPVCDRSTSIVAYPATASTQYCAARGWDPPVSRNRTRGSLRQWEIVSHLLTPCKSLLLCLRCLEFPDSAEFHPLMFVDGVIEAFVRRGGRVHEKTRVVTQTIMDGRQVCAGVTPTRQLLPTPMLTHGFIPY